MTTHKASTATAFANIPDTGLLAPPDATPLGGDINTWSTEVFATADESASVGFWKASTGRSRWELDTYSEAILVVAGRLIVTEDGESPVEFGPGDVAVFPKGWRGEWNIVEELQKFYTIF
jgi:uncharacterized cupin superfamily protein